MTSYKQIAQLFNDKKSVPFIVVVLFGLLTIIDILTAPSPQPSVEGANTVAMRVVDGDTVKVMIEGEEETEENY